MSDIINVSEYLVGHLYGELEIPISENDCLHSVEVNPQLFLIKKRDDGSFAIVKENGEKKVKSLNELHGCVDSTNELYPLCSYHTNNSNSNAYIYDEEGKIFEKEKLKDIIFRQKRKFGKNNGVGYYRPLKDFLEEKFNYTNDTISTELVFMYILKFNMSRSGVVALLSENLDEALKELDDKDIYYDLNDNRDLFKQNDSNIINTIKKG